MLTVSTDEYINPKDERLLVKPLEKGEETYGEMKIAVAREEEPDDGMTRPDPIKGEVLRVGPGELKEDGTRRAVQYRKGDIVIFTELGCSKVFYHGVLCYLVSELDILGQVQGL